MIIRRERVKKEVHKASQDVFYKQNDILESEQSTLSEEEFNKIASGNELMRFTKFPSYSMHGPPFADHLGEEGSAEDDTTSSGAYFSDGATARPHNEASCSNTSYTGDGAVAQPHIEANNSSVIVCGDGNERVTELTRAVTELIPMKDDDQQLPNNAANGNMDGKTAETLFNLNGIKKNLVEDVKEGNSKSNVGPQSEGKSSIENILNTNSTQNPDNQTRCSLS